MKHKTNFLIKIFLLLLLTSSAQAANIVATLDRNIVMLDESFRLVLESDGSVDDDPDFSVLQKDFEILSQNQSTNMTFINGSLSRKSVWNLALMGKNAGIFTIPSIAFGKDTSPALRITIKEATANANASAGGSEVYLEAEVDKKEAWLHSQVIYTVRLFSRLSMSNLRQSELSTNDPDTIIEPLGQAKSYEAFRGGMRYAVHEIRYAIYPQHSGTLTFSPMIFEGRVTNNNSQSIFDQFMNTGSLKRLRSEGINLTVKPKPSNIQTSDWIPASKLSLREEWSEDISQLKTGEPVTRTISIDAEGLLAAHLPDIELVDTKDLKQYSDKPVLENRIIDSGVASSKEMKIALIPGHAGRYTLPAINIAWFNTRTGQREVARLAETTLTVTGVANTVINPPPVITPVQENAPTKETDNGIPKIINQYINLGVWPWISLAFALAWLFTLIAYFRKGDRLPKIAPKPAPSLHPLEKAVQKYCSANNTHETKNALLAWAKSRWPEASITSLIDIADLTNAEFAEQLQILNNALYSAADNHWDGTKLAAAFSAFKRDKTKTEQASDSALKPLYKTSS